MQVHRFHEPLSFLERAEPFLLRAEAEHQLFLALRGTSSARAATIGDDGYLATVEDKGDVLACALRTPPFGLNLSRADTRALGPLIDDLSLTYPGLPSVFGPEPDVTHFLTLWRDRFGTTIRTLMRQRTFEARHVRFPERMPPGTLRLATASDLQTLESWAVAFHAEANPTHPIEPAQAMREHVAAQHTYVWDDVGVTCVAVTSRRSTHGATISLVYTPTDRRGRGYASACVAALTRLLLDTGAPVCRISTDLANVTSNAIYPALGFAPVCDMSLYDLAAIAVAEGA